MERKRQTCQNGKKWAGPMGSTRDEGQGRKEEGRERSGAERKTEVREVW